MKKEYDGKRMLSRIVLIPTSKFFQTSTIIDHFTLSGVVFFFRCRRLLTILCTITQQRHQGHGIHTSPRFRFTLHENL